MARGDPGQIPYADQVPAAGLMLGVDDLLGRLLREAARSDVSGTETSWGKSGEAPFPPDSLAVIEPDEPSVIRSARPLRGWLLRFKPRSATRHNPLTGWIGSEDPLRHVAIRFPTKEAALRYVERQGLAYELREPAPLARSPRAEAPAGGPLWLCCWPTGPHALCCGDYPMMKTGSARRDRDGATGR